MTHGYSKLSSLLLDSLHQDRSRLDVSALAALTAQEWADLLVLAGRQRVAPLLYHNLKGRGLERSLPEEFLQALRDSHMRNTARNLRLAAESGRIAEALDAEGIPVIALKGIHLAQEVYESIGLREMNDIDLLVQKPDLARAAEIVMNMGFRPLKPFSLDWGLPQKDVPRMIASGTGAVELHWSVAPPGRSPMFDIREFWEQSRPTELAGTTMLGLSPEDMVLYLGFHNGLHGFDFGLRPYCDTQAVISRWSQVLDWDAIVERAKRWSWERDVYLSLRLARELVGAGCSDSVEHALKPDQDTERMHAMAQVLAKTGMMHQLPAMMASYTQMTALGKAGFVARCLFPSRAELAFRYQTPPNSPAILLRYPNRWRDLVVRHWATLQAVRGRDKELSKLAERKGKLLRWLADGR